MEVLKKEKETRSLSCGSGRLELKEKKGKQVPRKKKLYYKSNTNNLLGGKKGEKRGGEMCTPVQC